MYLGQFLALFVSKWDKLVTTVSSSKEDDIEQTIITVYDSLYYCKASTPGFAQRGGVDRAKG